MNIEATDIARTFGRQTRAYAEFRIFSSLAPFSEVVRRAAVSLSPAAKGHAAVCSVDLDLEMGGRVRVRARGRHAFDAINRVAHRIGPALGRHAHVALPRYGVSSLSLP